MKLWTFVVVAAMSAIPGWAATLAWKGSASGGDWTLASNWNSSDGTFVLTDANDYDFSALADGARVVNDASGLTKVRSLTLPRAQNATWTLTGAGNLRVTTKAMPIVVPPGSTLNIDLKASNPWSSTPENSYALSGGGTLRHTKSWSQWTYPNISVSGSTLVIGAGAGGSFTDGFVYSTIVLNDDDAVLRLETAAHVNDVACAPGTAPTIDLNGNTLRRNLRDRSAGDWPGRLVGSGTLVVEGGIGLGLARAPEFAGTYDIRNGCLSFGTEESPLSCPSASSVKVTDDGCLKLRRDQTLSAISGVTPLGRIDIAEGATLTVADTADAAYPARLVGGGGLAKTGPATLTLSGRNAYAGATRVAAGTLVLDGKATDYESLWSFDASLTNDAVGVNHLSRRVEWGSYHFPLPTLSPNGRTGGCVHFDHSFAANTHPRLMTSSATPIGGTNHFTVGAWIRPAFSNVTSQVLFCGAYPSDSSATRLFQVNVMKRALTHSGVTWEQQRIDLPRGSLDDGAWHFVCATETDTVRRLYVDGELLDEYHAAFNIESGKLSIGGMDAWPSDFEGDIDDIFIVRRALSDDEVKARFACAPVEGAAGDAHVRLPEPVAKWTFDEDFTDEIGGVRLVSGVGVVSGATGTPVIESAPGAYGKCLALTASKTCLTLPAGAAFPSRIPTAGSPFTISMRMLIKEGGDGVHPLFAYGDGDQVNCGIWIGGFSYPARPAVGRRLSDKTSNYSYVDSSLGGAVAASGANEFGWTHVVVTYSGGKLSYYRDGRFVASQWYALDLRPQDLYLGYNKPSNVYKKGYIDDLRIFDVRLTDAEVAILADSLETGETVHGALPSTTAVTVENGAELRIRGTGHAAASLSGQGALTLDPGASLSVAGAVSVAGPLAGEGTLSADTLTLTGDGSAFRGALVSGGRATLGSTFGKSTLTLTDGVAVETDAAGSNLPFAETPGTFVLPAHGTFAVDGASGEGLKGRKWTIARAGSFVLPDDLSGWTLPTPPAGESWQFAVEEGELRLLAAQALAPDGGTLTIDAATMADALPFVSTAGAVSVPETGTISFVGFGDGDLLNSRFVLARSGTGSFATPENWNGWRIAGAPDDGRALAFAVEGRELVARVVKVARVWGAKGGVLSTSGMGEFSLTPRFTGGSWKSYSPSVETCVAESDGTRRFTLGSDEGHVIDGCLRLEQKDDRTVRATWTFTPRGDVSYVQVHVNGFPSVSRYQDGELDLDGTVRALPLTADASAKVSSVALKDARGEMLFSLAFPDEKRTVSVTPPSSWSVHEFAFTASYSYVYPKRILYKDTDYVLTADLTCSRPVRLVDEPTPRVAAGPDWVPLDPVRFPQPGSALDFSAQRGTTGVAGSHGRVIKVGDHFEFENVPGVAQRFYGNNLDLKDGAPSGEAAERLAQDMARFGYNAMRIWLQDGIAWRGTGDPALVTLNPAGMEKIDWFLAKFFENGIYVTLDLGCSRTNTWRSVGIERNGNMDTRARDYLIGIHDGIRRNYIDWLRAFFTHRNPYTGRTYAEEPAIIGFNVLNESNNILGQAPQSMAASYPEVVPAAWSAFVARKKAEDPVMFGGLTEDIPSSYAALPNGPTYLMMLAEGERRLAADVRRLLHEELGSSIPVANMNGGTLPMAFVAANDAYDYDDKHRYVDHPSFVEEGWRLPATPGSGNRNFVSGNHVGSIYSARMIDRPFTISEDNLCTPWRNAAASGFAIGAIAALQGTAATYRFCWANLANYGTPERQTPGSYFNVTANPLMAASERLAIALFPRGDLGAYAKRYVYTVDPAFMASTNAANADTPATYFPFGWAAWRARVGFVASTEVPAGAIDAGAWPGMMRKLRPEICTDLGIDRPSGTETLPDGSTVNVDFDSGSLAVATPRTAAGYAESGTVVAGPLTARLNGTASTVWVSSLDGSPLSRSVRMLFGHLTEAQAEGRAFADPGFSTLLRWGGPQNLMRAGRADVALALGRGRFEVYALAADGTRRFRVPCTATDGVLRFTADVAADPTLATCQYEIVRGGGLKVIVR